MQDILSQLDRKAFGLAKEIGQIAQEKGLGAYLVGGPVRDLLLNRKIFDLDFVIEGDALKVADEFARRHKARCVRYPVFKTATVVMSDASAVDLASARREVYVFSGAMPAVVSSGIADDLFRRDFTVNAMAVSVTPGTFGVLVDPYDGFKDLAQKRIRVLHPRSFVDDPTRLLRAVRFEARLKFWMDKETLKLYKEALAHKAISFVKPQRYFEEFKKILNEADVRLPLARLHQLRALKVPPLDLVYNERRAQGIAQAVLGLRSCVRYGIKGIQPWLVYLMVINDEERPEDLAFVLGQLGLSSVDKEKLVSSLLYPKVLGKLSAEHLKASGAYVLLKTFGLEPLLFFRSRANGAARRRIDRFLRRDRETRLGISGEDLKGLGIPEGQRINVILKEILKQVIDQTVRSKEQQMRLARNLGGA